MPYELLLLITLFVTPVAVLYAWRFWLCPSASARRPHGEPLQPAPRAPGSAARVPSPRARRSSSGALRLPPQAVLAARWARPASVRAIPLGTAPARGGVRLLIILAPPRPASRPALGSGPAPDPTSDPPESDVVKS